MRMLYDIGMPDISGGGGPATTAGSMPPAPVMIPRPNYNDPASRLTFAQNFTKQYGPLMQGRGDTPLRINETPRFASGSSKDISTAAAKGVGIDPALLYSSAMEEGMSGMYKNKDGGYDYERSGQSDKFPVNSSADFGLDQVRDKIKTFQQKGYLPADFQNHIVNSIHPKGQLGSGGKPVTQNDVDIDTVDNAMKLKAAYMKSTYDDIDSYAKQRKITLSPKARDFFALVDYNGGEGTGHQMLNDYNNNGYLEGDKFLQKRPTTGQGLSDKSYKTVYENVARRTQMASALKEQKLFE